MGSALMAVIMAALLSRAVSVSPWRQAKIRSRSESGISMCRA